MGLAALLAGAAVAAVLPFLPAAVGFGLRPCHLPGALLGDDDVALLLGGGLIVDVLERIGPGLSRGLARAGWIELLTVAKRVRQRRIGLAADRHRRTDVLPGIAIGEQGGFGCGTQRLAGFFVVGETLRARWRTRSGNKRRRSCGRRRCGRCRIADRNRHAATSGGLLLPEQIVSGNCPGPARAWRIAGRNCSARAPSAPSGAGCRDRRRRNRRRAAVRGCW